MKKKIAALLLTLGMIGLAVGWSDEEEYQNTDNTASEETSVTNADGLVVAVDVDNLEDYVTLGEYQNLTVEEAPKTEVTDEDVDDYIERQLINNYAPVEVTEDRAVQENDTVNIDYAGYLDGEAFDGGTAQDQDLLIGSGGFIEGFEDGLIGHKKGETVTLNLTFPEDYSRNPDLAGQAVVFEVTINSISEPATLTDEWVAANTDYKSVEEFHSAQEEQLVREADNEYESQVKSDLFQIVMENSEIKDYPEEELNELKADIQDQMEQMYLSYYGMSLDEALETQGISQEEAEQSYDETARSYMSQYLLTQAILDAEEITLTEEEYQNALEEFAALSGFSDAEELESNYSDQNVLKRNVLWNVACDAIMSTATITETAEDTQTEAE